MIGVNGNLRFNCVDNITIEVVSLMWKANEDEHITYLTLANGNGRSSFDVDIHVLRLQTWGWELRNEYFICRAIDGEGNLDEQWEDLLANIIVQERPEWAEVNRTHFEVNCREVPDDEDCKALPW